jgi:hypothetical protein
MLFLRAGTIKIKHYFISLYEFLFMHFKGLEVRKRRPKIDCRFQNIFQSFHAHKPNTII